MIIELRSGDKKAIVDTKGGYLTNYSDERGDILYPKRSIAAANGEQKLGVAAMCACQTLGQVAGTGSTSTAMAVPANGTL